MEFGNLSDLNFTPQSGAILGKRSRAKDGKIDRILGKGKRFAPGFKRMVRGDHEGILQLPYLRHDLEALRRILNALDRDPLHAGAAGLIKMFKGDPGNNGYDSILCPVARQVRSLDLQTGAVRYFYPEVRGQLSLVTIIMGFAESLDALEIKLAEARSSMDQIAKVVTKAGRGLVAFGAFEPDLRSECELNERRDLAKAKAELGWDVDDAGGWVLSGHFLVRAVDLKFLAKIFRKQFPSHGWPRVQFKHLDKTQAVSEAVFNTLNYIMKRNPAFELIAESAPLTLPRSPFSRKLRTTFVGPQIRNANSQTCIDKDHATRQLAIFLHSMGFDKMTYSVETAHAQRWYTRLEELMFIEEEWWENLHGYWEPPHAVEIHRDLNPSLPKLRRRSRRLTAKSADIPAPELGYIAGVPVLRIAR